MSAVGSLSEVDRTSRRPHNSVENDPDRNKLTRQCFFRLLSSGIGLACKTRFLGGGTRRVKSTLKIKTPSAITLIEKIKAEFKKRAELKAKRMLLKVPKRQAKR